MPPRPIENSFDINGNLTFRVLDTVKIKVETTTEFPLDFKCSILFTQEDVMEYAQRKQHQEAEKEMQETEESASNQFECFAEDFNH